MSDFGSNTGYVDDLFERYSRDPNSVGEAWREFFAGYAPRSKRPSPSSPAPSSASGGPAQTPETSAIATAIAEAPDRIEVAAESAESEQAAAHGERETIRGPAARLVANMEESLHVPTATSVRTIPVELLDENRRIINHHMQTSNGIKVSYTHIIAYAIVRALKQHGTLNDQFVRTGDEPQRVQRPGIHLGLAIDVEKRGERMLLVPNIKNAEHCTFREFVTAYNDLVARARAGRLTIADFEGTTVTITNPGTAGTVLSVPRLMAGQGAIVGVGRIGHSAEFSGMSPAALQRLGISPVMTLTSTYDHRIIQGAESGAFLGTIERLLCGGDGFYLDIFDSMAVPYQPFELAGEQGSGLLGVPSDDEAISKQTGVIKLVNAYRVRGHLIADLNPLGYEPVRHPELALSYHGLSVWDLDREFIVDDLAGATGKRTLREILEILRSTYCGYLGAEFMYIADHDVKLWLKEQLETVRASDALPADQQLRIFEKLNAAEAFERFLHSSYVGHKRFSLEGCETLIPVLDALLEQASRAGTEEVVIGMAHRGRLNVLANILGKSLEQIFQEFEESDPRSTEGSGDVKYHLGARGTHTTADGSTLALRLASNPSHLEAVNPVVQGMTRALQDIAKDSERRRVLAVEIHGDAAFAGQGVVAEALNMSQLDGFTTGGTIHVLVNNQIGFTTNPRDARSTHYASDLAKGFGVPVLHANADHPQAAVRAISLACAFRETFRRDVVVELVCYRRFGHNEADEPAFTQPVMVERIRRQRSVRKLYAEQLLRQGSIDVATAEKWLADFQKRLALALDEARSLKSIAHTDTRMCGLPSPHMERARKPAPPPAPPPAPAIATAVPLARLDDLVTSLSNVPENFAAHPKLAKQIEQRRAAFEGDRIDWALAESLAFGTLLQDGVPIRLCGQDSRRGTFSQRHAVLFDHRDGQAHTPLAQLAAGAASFQAIDSLLSEYAAMGFEYGYSIARPEALVLWEAQFGDFVNGAQIVIDRFIASAEEKWGQHSRLTLLLPHGFEGQGPEHSSARLERFLQLCAEGNLRVAYPATAAQYFHLLRRQALAAEAKPLVVMTPKSLLRLPAAASNRESFTSGGFEEVIDDNSIAEPAGARRLILASGKIYHELVEERARRAADAKVAIASVAIARIEQFYPFPRDAVRAIVARYPAASEVLWVQEEPANMGAWEFLRPRLALLLREGTTLRYVGRPPRASPATGSLARHRAEQQQILESAF